MEVWTTRRAEFASFLLMRELDPAGIQHRIKQARNELGLTQQELADALQVHKRTIENYENVRVPPWNEIGPLAAVLHVTVAWLLHGDAVASEPSAEAVAARLDALEESSKHVEELLRVLLQRLPDGPGADQSAAG